VPACRRMPTLALFAALALALAPTPASAGEARLFDGLGSHHRKVTTSSPAAQRWFDQGLVFVMSFNHDEAIRSFTQAALLDSGCAMAWWGIALAKGPHINNPAMSPEASQAAWEALRRARARLATATPAERALVEALASRYAEHPPEDRHALDEAYAAAMREVWARFPQDADVGSLFAEALMDLRPWDLWRMDGSPQPGTDEILATLERVLKLAPSHPGANHLYVHAVEASPHPERGLPSADRLRTLVPSAGHMVHMPAHIYCRVGRWADAATANEKAIEADRRYRERSPRQGFYNVYMAHNRHFLSWASQMEGRSAVALKAAREMMTLLPEDFVRDAAYFADGFLTIEMETLMRFGRWDEVLAVAEPADYLPISRAFRHYTRGAAFAAQGKLDEAAAEQAAFREACSRVTEPMIVGNNPARRVLSIADHQLEGEILNRRGDVDGAVRELSAGVAIEDSLRYDESPDWLLPVRHALGAVLVRAKRWPEAEAVYRADLARNAENGWSLWGLARSLRAQGRESEAEAAEARYRKAWKRADVSLESTCYCQVW
jgi:tetratricopeptide (TPR) repeat protein